MKQPKPKAPEARRIKPKKSFKLKSFGFDDLEGSEMWEQKAMFDQKERAKMIISALEEEPELHKEFFLELRRRKLKQLKK